MRSDYITKSIGPLVLMDGGDPTAFTNALYRPPVLNLNGADVGEYLFGLGYFRVVNRTGATIVAGVCARLKRTRWKAGGWTDATTTYTDKTTQAQNTTANDFPLETLTNNDGFVVQSADPITLINLNIGTASVGGTPVRVIEYTKAGGSWGTALVNALVPPTTSAQWALGENLIWWSTPPDLAPIEAGHGTGLTVGLYGIRIRATTAPGTTAGVASSLSCGEALDCIAGLATALEYTTGHISEYKFKAHADALFAVLSSKASVGSIAEAQVRTRG